MDNQDMFIAQEYIKEFLASNKRKLMVAGQKYFEADNDIIMSESNSKLPHGFMYNMISEKIQYLLGKAPSVTSNKESSVYLEEVKRALGRKFLHNLSKTATEASNKGISWKQAYFDDNMIKFMVIPAEQCCPVWVDNDHEELKWMIRLYDVEVYTGTKKEKVTKAELYDENSVYYYIWKDNKLVIDAEKYLNIGDGQEFGHFTLNNQQYSFGRVPFVACKNNMVELPDLKFVKGLIDAYDKSRSNLDELLEDFKNFLVIIKNYAGDSENAGALEEMLKNRRIFVDADGGVDLVSPSIDTTANESHNNTLKDDIILFGRSVDRNKMSSGNAPSGIALKALYSGLDLKCNELETGIQTMFEDSLYFINVYLSLVNVKVPSDEELSIILNRDVTMNESAVITDCKNSVGVISKETIIENHPYVKDVEVELQRIENENSIDMSQYVKGDIGGQEQ